MKENRSALTELQGSIVPFVVLLATFSDSLRLTRKQKHVIKPLKRYRGTNSWLLPYVRDHVKFLFVPPTLSGVSTK